MSDDEGSSGIFEDAIAAKNSNNWEARLKEAREKRAKVLTGAQEEAPERRVLNSSETAYLPQPDETQIEEIVSDRVRSLYLEELPVRKKPKFRAGIILAALACGAFLQWAITNISEIWHTNNEPASENLDTFSENFPEIEELLSDSASTTGIASLPVQQDTLAAQVLAESEAPEAAPDPNPSIIEETEDAINETPLDQSVLVEAVVTSPIPTENISDSDGREMTKPIPQVPRQEPDVPSSPPAIFIPAQLDPILAAAAPAGIQALVPTPVEPPSRHSNLLNKDIFSQSSLMDFDPVPQEITLSAVPSYAEVKPLQPAQSPIDLEVSLFVPSRVTQEASSRAFELLTQGRATVVSTDRVGFRIRETQVRFYHSSDAENAALAADALGGVLRDFTNSGSKTRPGRIEVYLAGSGGAARRTSDSQPTEFDNFIARILNEFR